MSELRSNPNRSFVVTSMHRAPAPPDNDIAAAIRRLLAQVQIEDVAVDPEAGVATLSAPPGVDADALRRIVGEDFLVGPNERLNF